MSRRFTLVARLLLLCLLWLALMFTARQVRQEWRIIQAETGNVGRLVDQTGRVRVNIDQLPPRAALSLALAMARESNAIADNRARMAKLAQSELLLGSALDARPRWGEAETVATYLSMLQHGGDDRRTLDAFARSLKYAPYLKEAWRWRVRFGAQHWNSLDLETQNHVLDEARWVSHNARSDALLIKSLLGEGKAACAFYRQGGHVKDLKMGLCN